MTGALFDALKAALDDLEDAARKAENHPWKLWGMQVLADPVGDSNHATAIPVAHAYTPTTAGRLLSTHNARHIAQNDPPTVLRRVEAERRVLDRHSPMEWWAWPDGIPVEPTEETRQPTFCRHCTSLRDEDAVPALESGDDIDLGTPIVVYPCEEIRDLADRLGVEVSDGT